MDENEGMGGSYTRDPKTGKRTLVQRTENQPAPAEKSGDQSGKTETEGE